MSLAVSWLDEDRVERFLTDPSPATFTPLFEDLYPRLLRYFLSHRLDRASAEELSQDVLLAVYRGAAGLRARELFLGWVFKIARNALFKQTQKNHRVEMVSLAPELAAVTAVYDSAGADFRDALAGLEGPDREILSLRYAEELSYQAIATALGLPMGTVKWRLFHAKQSLAAVLLKKVKQGV